MPKVIRFAGLLIVAGLACGTATADEKKPATLTSKEVAEGWISLFDGETTYGWKILEGEAKVENGMLVVGGAKPTKIVTTTRFGGLEYQIAVKAGEGKPAPSGGLYLPAVPQTPAFSFQGVKLGTGSGAENGDGRNRAGAIRIEVPAGHTIQISKLWVRPCLTAPLLNGKDLTGWKVFQDPKRSRTKFEVTPAGELHITNGPGDLQTEKKYADFILQLDCKINGKNLNSGVFFRCMPDQYQNGYEAQIHNGYKNNDRTKPTDFGTGAIYRRVPARKVVANDNEWFTMTVVADGPHFATWVNGYQTVGWTDERKPSDNPRQGLRTAAGHLSIQGHDPTTDILFRNIRIAELKK